MKKVILVIFTSLLATLTSTGAFAASATVEFQSIDNVNPTTTDQTNYSLTVREDIKSWLTGDVAVLQNNNDGSQGYSSSRVEAGLTPKYKLNNYVTLYAREAIGNKYTSTTHSSYWSAEPGVMVPIGATGLTAKVGWRYRTAFNDAVLDTTRTWRAGVGYDITPKDNIGVRYDRVQGDADQRIWAVNYTRGF
jgi:hypothetical protein